MYYTLHKDLREKFATKGQRFARAVSLHNMTTDQLAEHMSKHNTPYSKGVIAGVLRDMASCVKEAQAIFYGDNNMNRKKIIICVLWSSPIYCYLVK